MRVGVGVAASYSSAIRVRRRWVIGTGNRESHDEHPHGDDAAYQIEPRASHDHPLGQGLSCQSPFLCRLTRTGFCKTRNVVTAIPPEGREPTPARTGPNELKSLMRARPSADPKASGATGPARALTAATAAARTPPRRLVVHLEGGHRAAQQLHHRTERRSVRVDGHGVNVAEVRAVANGSLGYTPADYLRAVDLALVEVLMDPTARCGRTWPPTSAGHSGGPGGLPRDGHVAVHHRPGLLPAEARPICRSCTLAGSVFEDDSLVGAWGGSTAEGAEEPAPSGRLG